MMIPAYDEIYLSKSSRTIGNMLHDAIYVFHINGNVFLNLFIQSGIARQIEIGNPKYIAGKSGLEIFLEVMEITSGKTYELNDIVNFERSDAYWVGWALAHYQWYSNCSFKDILSAISYDDLVDLYSILHEADIQKTYEVIDEHFNKVPCKLKQIRLKTKMSQQQLADHSGISINTIRSYEQKQKDINKAQLDIVIKLANSLKCNITDLLK
ncbi:MAG: helix-turn-helix domain-containing protein [Erysipelotrichaceae bacterium]|nr:helix-turn-helix domain-containing protein [Erysipelotrichaceae bacterium]MDY5251419.1 helix-turn-helix transcriptional regulator [Erysipelotrichaceae bacterium]